MQKFISWILFLGILTVNLGLIGWFWIGYNLLTPHSNIVYTGWTYWSWKLLLIQLLLSGALLLAHLFFGGRALLQGDAQRARKVTLIVLIVLILQLALSFIR